MDPAQLLADVIAARRALVHYREAMVEQKCTGAALAYCHGVVTLKAALAALPKLQLVRSRD